MWNNPRLLNTLAGLLAATALEITTASAPAMCSRAWVGWMRAPSPARRRVRALSATSEPLTS